MTSSRLPIRRWFPFTRAGFHADLVAGLLLGLVAVPQCLAYATLAGMPPHYGLWAAILPCVAGAVLGWSNHLHTGPVAMTALLTSAVLAPLAAPGTPAWIAAALLLALLVGLIRIAAGLLRASVIADLVSHPVLAGFTAGAALVIIGSQVHSLLGVPHDGTGLMIAGVVRESADLSRQHGATVLMSAGCIAAMLALRAWAPRWPGMLIVLVTATAVSWGIGFAGKTVGAVPNGLPPLTWPTWDTSFVLTLLPGAGWVALIGFLEVLSVVKTCAARTGQDIDLDREMIAQGAASIAAASTGGFPVSGSLSRSSLALTAGARTGMAAVWSAGVVLAVLLCCGPLLAPLPYAALAAAIVVSALSLIDLGSLRRAWRANWHDGLAGLLTLVATVALAPQVAQALALGAALTVVLLLSRLMRPRVCVLGRHGDGTWRDHERHGLALGDELAVLRVEARLHFGNISVLEREVIGLRARFPAIKALVLSGEGVNEIDASGCEALRRLAADLQAAGVVLVVAAFRQPVVDTMTRAGLLGPDSMTRGYRTIDNAVHDLTARLGLRSIPDLPSGPCPAI